MKFATRLSRFGDEIFASLNEKKLQLEAEGKKIYNLSIGTPDFVPPKHIMEALTRAAQDPANWKYSLRDLPRLQETVCAYYKKRFGVDILPAQVMSCYGTQEGVGHLALALLDPGDCILLPDPCYPVFLAGPNLAEADPWFYPLSKETDFLPDLSTIPDEVADRAKMMIVSLPSNPVGSIAREGLYEELVAWARKHDVLIVHDNAYSDIIFDGEVGKSFLATPGAQEVGVEFFSLSKSFNVTGARISFLIGRQDVIDAVRLLRSQIDFGMFLPIQEAAIAALEGPTESVRAQCQDYEDRRNALIDGARQIGWEIPRTKGSMFVWAPIPEKYSSSMAFCLDLLEKAGVLCTPGSSFGPHGEGYLRLTAFGTRENTLEAIERICRMGG